MTKRTKGILLVVLGTGLFLPLIFALRWAGSMVSIGAPRELALLLGLLGLFDLAAALLAVGLGLRMVLSEGRSP